MRPEAEDHVDVRGTMVSTFASYPSKLPVSCVQTWGMPNRHGIVHVDGVALNIRYDTRDTNLIHVWAHVTERRRRGSTALSARDGDSDGAASLCVLS